MNNRLFFNIHNIEKINNYFNIWNYYYYIYYICYVNINILCKCITYYNNEHLYILFNFLLFSINKIYIKYK